MGAKATAGRSGISVSNILALCAENQQAEMVYRGQIPARIVNFMFISAFFSCNIRNSRIENGVLMFNQEFVRELLASRAFAADSGIFEQTL